MVIFKLIIGRENRIIFRLIKFIFDLGVRLIIIWFDVGEV